MSQPPSSSSPSPKEKHDRLTLSAILLHDRADVISGWLLVGMLVFSPWAFGTTQSWAVWTMNVCGYALGLLLGAKLWIRFRIGHKPLRWNNIYEIPTTRWRRCLTVALAVITGVILIYCAVAALNARADYDPIRLTLSYRDCLRWLPHSYDRMKTWSVLCDYLAWACAFWALRDWLLGMTAEESRAARSKFDSASVQRPAVPARLQLLLWIIAINGAVLGIEGIVQRLEGSGRLLFLIKPVINPGADTQFGPYHYRSNAIQYLNLIWPVTLGFWWWLRRTASRGARRSKTRTWLLLCAAIMAACPIVSSSRAGALTGMALLAMAVAVLISGKRADGLAKLAVLGVFGLALAGGAYLGWQGLSPRLNELAEGYRMRELMYKTAWVIADEHPTFGTGPGTFEHVFQIYRQSTNEYWPAQLHNDWLEILLTFGGVGFGMILLAFTLVLAHGFCEGAIETGRRFVWLTWLALAGCLLQARWDFPFRVYSIVFLFLALCAVLTAVGGSRRNR